jgi:hypothetical protein
MMTDDDYLRQMRASLNTTDARFNVAFHEATGDPERIAELIRSLSDSELLVQRACVLPDDARAAIEAEIARREEERRRR